MDDYTVYPSILSRNWAHNNLEDSRNKAQTIKVED